MRVELSRLLGALVAAAALAGCPDSSGTNSANDLSTVVDMTVRPDLRVIRPDMAGPTGAVRGTVKDEAGVGIENEPILVCSPIVCRYGTSSTGGNFQVDELQFGNLAVKTEENRDAVPKKGAALAPIKVVSTMPIDVGSIYVPTIPQVTQWGATMDQPQTLAVGDGLSLTFVRKDLTVPLGAEKDTYFGARLVPPERAAKTLDFGGETPVAIYALMPFTTKSASKIGVKVAIQLPAGTKVNFRSVGELDGLSSPPAAGEEAMDGMSASTKPGEGVDNLTYLLVSTPK